jgi:aryl-alcohol dehydrogenase-like predicted oxidoreductase
VTGRLRLGRSVLEISRTGFGAWSIGGSGWDYSGGSERDATSVAAMVHAFESGVNWVDTAPTYGQGHSEELVGRAVRLAAEKPLVFTKCGRRWDGPGAKPRSDLRPSSIRSDCEAALRRMRLEAIDLLQIHWPEEPDSTPLEESWGELLLLVQEGRIRAAGVCNFDVARLARCHAVGDIHSLQTPLSLIARDSAAELLDWCVPNGTGVLVYSPMHVGLLTDSFRPTDVDRLEQDDWRRSHPEFQAPRINRNLALRDALRPIAAAHSTTVAAVAVAWALSWRGVTGAIVAREHRSKSTAG